MLMTSGRTRLLRRLAEIAASTALTAAIFVLPAKAADRPEGRHHHLCRHRSRQIRGLARHGKAARPGGRCADRQAVGRHAERRAGGLEGGAAALPADRGLPLRQRDRRRLGRPRECVAARRRPDRLCRRELRNGVRREFALYGERHRQPVDRDQRRQGRRLEDHAGAAVGHAAGSRRHRSQCRHRLSRDRVPAVGAGPARHRARRRRAPLYRLRHRQLHRRQLRPARPVPGGGFRPAGLGPRGDGRQLEGGRRGAQGAGRRRAEDRACRRSSPAWARCPMASSPASA